MCVCEILIILTLVGRFLEQPGPEPVLFAAVGTRVEFTCSVDTSNKADWEVFLPNRDEAIYTNQRNSESFLNNQHIGVDGLETSTSTISLNASSNGTSVACVIFDENLARSNGHTIQVIFYGMC